MSKKNALKELAEPDYLSKVFDEMYAKSNRRKREREDRYGISLELFKKNKNDFIRKLSSSLKEKRYIFRNLEPYFLIKPNGKERIICSSSIKDKLVQKSVLKLLNERGYSFGNSVNFGFIKDKDKTVEKALAKALKFRENKRWAYKTDITAFFDKIDRNILKIKAKNKIRVKSLHDLIFQMISCEIHCENKVLKDKIKNAGIQYGLGLRQGMPISPYLSNVMLLDFDKMLEANNISAVRYADDLIIFAENYEECMQYHEMVKCELGKIGLSIPDIGNDSKTVVYSETETVDFLGIGIAFKKDKYYPILTNKQMDKIREKINNYRDIDYCINNNLTLSVLLKRLDRVIDGYKQAYRICQNKTNLENSLSDLRKMVIVHIFKNYLSKEINIDALTNNQKKFFEIAS